MAKTRKCPECSTEMNLRKSSKGDGGKFWGCKAYPTCKKTLPYFGDGAKVGCDIDIRQITNGFILRVSAKYVEEAEEDAPTEIFVKPDQLELVMIEVLNREVKKMMDQISSQIDSGFDKDEDSEAKKAQQPQNVVASDHPITGGEKSKDIKKLLVKARGTALPAIPHES